MVQNQTTPTEHSSLVGGSTASRHTKRPARELTPEEVRQLLEYDAATGLFTWRARPLHMFKGDDFTQRRCGNAWNARYAGTPALTADSEGRGYLVGSVLNTNAYAHRFAWMHFHGEHVPEGMMVDHINGKTSDNRIENLRLVTPLQSQFNRKPREDSLAGLKGVAHDKRRKKRPWMAMIRIQGKTQTLGYFNTPEEAAAAYIKAADRHQNFYVYHNRPTGDSE